MVTVTHTDTSTGVLSDIKAVSELVQKVSPGTLVVVDGVCSVGCEEIRFDEWGLDVVLTASQKAIGVPAGLCIMMLSGRAVKTFESRKAPPGSYFASLANWLPSEYNALHLMTHFWTDNILKPSCLCSFEELRGQKAILLCYTFTPIDPCSAYLFNSNPLDSS